MSSNKNIMLSIIVIIASVAILAVLDAAGLLTGIIDIPSSTYIVLLLASGLATTLLVFMRSGKNI